MTELQSFELFRPHGEQNFFIRARNKNIGISKDAYDELKKPEFVLVYFDDVKRRVLIKVVDKQYENAVKIIRHNSGGNKSGNMCICCKALTRKMISMFSTSNRVYGHLVSDGVMVFDKPEVKSWQDQN